MDSNGPVQAFDTPFDMSDYVNFDFDFEAPHESIDSISTIPMAVPLQNMTMEDPNLGLFDAAATLESRVEINSVSDDFLALNPASEDFRLTDADAFQTRAQMDTPLHDLTVFEPTASVHGIDPAALNIHRSRSAGGSIPLHQKANPQSVLSAQTLREPSRWVPVSPQMQKYLNKVYAPQLTRLRTSPNPPPVLYLPAQQQIEPSLLGSSVLPNTIPSQDIFLPTSPPSTETLLPDLSPMIQGHGGLPPQQPISTSLYRVVSPTRDNEAAKSDSPALDPSRKRALDARDSDSGPAPKRTKKTEADLSSKAVKENDADDDGEPVMIKRRATRLNPMPIIPESDASDDDSEDESVDDLEDEAYTSDSSDLSVAPQSSALPLTPVARKGPPNPVVKKAPGKCSTPQHKQERKPRSAENSNSKTNPTNRKMQKLLRELQDSEGFVQAQGCDFVGSAERESLPKRPVRKGARKNYVGLE
ncbi:hypothetical protein IMSHALPRED_000528 [Imshaugia aleurites]|uniref:Uncharacterized protein n=1 Tax=Imshaugia aleurites TaxID=172621 RepID=A0A8H3IXG3_9LECA|nr:hypothetical protein IMSHALPRED_000528 [Imshaugia aleurites]